ncbi:ROK family transcriptional regulator [Sphingomonadaceae bacterium OTU29THOMA1]|nr:ROK family transcriptional regulator [Sphingomonadaceae bacterium OTU29THOMA1]
MLVTRPPAPEAALTDTERKILSLTSKMRRVTQSDLAAALGLAQQSVSRLVSGLLSKGALDPADKIAGSKGYRSTAVKVRGSYAHAAGVTISAGAVTLVIIDLVGEVVLRHTAHIQPPRVDDVVRLLDEQIIKFAEATGIEIVGVGISIAGSFINARSFNTPIYLDDWAGFDIANVLGEKLQRAVWADNDGNSAALAEAALGAGQWAPSFAYLYLGAGVGGGVVLSGEPWRGRFGNAGEFAGGLPPNIYPFPNLELLRQLLARDGHVFETVDTMAVAYEPGWLAIDEWIARVRDSVSIIGSNATAILDLDAIVIGGLAPTDLSTRLIEHIELFDQRRRQVARPVAKLIPAEVVSDAAAIGAAMLPLRARYFLPVLAGSGAPTSAG